MGKDIHKFMPSFFANGHRQRLQEWVTNQIFDILKTELTDCYTADKNKIAFSAFSYLKVHSDGRKLKVYKMIVRDNDRDYLILKKDGTIEAIGNRLTELKLFSETQIGSNVNELIELPFLEKVKDNEKDWLLVRPFKTQKESFK